MSRRNTSEEKRRRRINRSIRKGRLPAYINLIDWIKLRVRCTTGQAKRALLAGALRVDSHPVGVKTVKDYLGKDVTVVDPFLPAEFRNRIVVVKPDVLDQGEAA